MLLSEDKAHRFYRPLEKGLEAARSMLTSEIERLTEVLETGEETFGKSVQEQYGKRKEHKYASKNKKVKQI